MSAPNWLNDAQAYPNGENVAFNGANDPSMSFMQTPSSSSFDFNTVQAQQMRQRMANGDMLNGSNANANIHYQTQTSIPSKRPRPPEDNVGGSPQPFTGAAPASRSQTPHGSYSTYQAPVNGVAFAGGNPYQNMPQNVNPSNPSPTPQNQNFNTSNTHQHVQTMSPSPYSPATQNFGHHASPSHSENGSRVNTPQNNTSQYPPAAVYGASTVQPFMSQGAAVMNGPQQSQFSQTQQHEQQMILDARARQMALMRGGVHSQGGPFNPMGQLGNQLSNSQLAQIRAQQAQQAQQANQRNLHVQQTLQSYMNFARSRGLPFQTQTVIMGKQHLTMNLFFGVLKMGGSRSITSNQQWPKVAQLLQYHPTHHLQAAQELQNFWQTYLSDFEIHYSSQNQRPRPMGDPLRTAGNFPPGDPNLRQTSFSPPKQGHEQGPRFLQPPQNQMQNPPKPIATAQSSMKSALPNGYANTQQMSTPEGHPTSSFAEPRSDATLHQLAAPVTTAKARPQPKVETRNEQVYYEPRRESIGEMYRPKANNLNLGRPSKEKSDNSKQDREEVATHGGLRLDSPFTDNVAALLKYKLRAPLPDELGPIYIHTLTLSLQSGISGEVRHALDTLLLLSLEEAPPSLDNSDDLTEALTECANDQIDLLAEHAPEVSDAMMISSYEDTVKVCKAEVEEVEVPTEFRATEHDLETAVDKLICITTILRNFAFAESRNQQTRYPEPNSHQALKDPLVLKMMINVMRYLGTRNMFLRTHRNALDFSKDVVIFLSQMAHLLDFQSKDDALCALHFLMSFAPMPDSINDEVDEVYFPSYSPSANRYLPYAIDALAKLLTRETNRAFCRSILTSDNTTAHPYELFTKAFGLAISPIPDLEALHKICGRQNEAKLNGVHRRDTRDHVDMAILNLIRYRSSFLIQGLLVAEILVGMIPNTEYDLALSWLRSQDGFALRLLRTLALLYDGEGRYYGSQMSHPHTGQQPQNMETQGFHMATSRGLNVLQKLIDRAKDAGGDGTVLLPGTVPSKRTIYEALKAKSMDVNIVRKLCSLYALDS